MKVLKKILLAVCVAASLSAVSNVAYAETDKGRVTYAPAEAIDRVAQQVQVAINALTTGSSAEEVDKLVKAALDSSKEINANDKVDNARAKANNKLKKARDLIKNSATQEAEALLREAHDNFLKLKSLI